MRTIKYGLFILVLCILFISYVSKAKKSAEAKNVNRAAITTGDGKTTNKYISELIDKTPDNTGIKWDVKDISGFGKIPMPTGTGWINNGDRIAGNRILGCEVTLKSDAGNYSESIKEYLDSYKATNQKDMPGYKIILQKVGVINNISAAVVTGNFDNGTKFITRDILIFKKDAVQIIQSRVKQENSASLNIVLDYMAVCLR